MLRFVAAANISAVSGSKGSTRSKAVTPPRCLCNMSKRRINRSNNRSRTGPSDAASVSAA